MMNLTDFPTKTQEEVINALKENKNTTVYFNNTDGYYVTSEAITEEQSSKSGHHVARLFWADEV